jgi:hypothetical protein
MYARGCFLEFRRTQRAACLVDEPRRRLCLSRFADDCRLPSLRFECLAKISVITDLTKTFDWPRSNGIDKLIVGRAGGLRKLVELLLQVKDLFLQIYDLAGA